MRPSPMLGDLGVAGGELVEAAAHPEVPDLPPRPSAEGSDSQTRRRGALWADYSLSSVEVNRPHLQPALGHTDYHASEGLSEIAGGGGGGGDLDGLVHGAAEHEGCAADLAATRGR